jgi:hypothetical protein
MAVLRSILLRFAFHYPICVLVLWAITGREWGGPGAAAAALFATIITTIQARYARAPRRAPVQPLTLSADVARAEICDQLNDVSWLRANGMMLTAALLDTISDLDGYAWGQWIPDRPAATGMTFEEFRTAQREPCGCVVNASGPAYADAPHPAYTTTIPCLGHAGQGTLVRTWPADTVSRETAKAEGIERSLDLERVADEALNRAHGTRWMGAR